MTIDLEKIKRLNWPALYAVRQNIGAESGSDESKDERIKRMTPEEFVQRYAEWQLGDPAWGDTFYSLVHTADEAGKFE